MTPKLIIYLTLSFLIFLFFPLWILQILMLCFIFIVLISYLYSTLSYKSIRIVREDKVIYTNPHEKITINFTLTNNNFLPIDSLMISDSFPGLFRLSHTDFMISMKKKSSLKLSYTLEGRKRGEYTVSTLTVSGSDPFCIFPWKKTFTDETKIIIYPKSYKLFKRIDKGIAGGSIKVNNKIYEDLNYLKSIRKYVSGDELRRINWKISSKFNELHTMEFTETINNPVLILLNLKTDDFYHRYRVGLIENAIETAASYIKFFILKKQKIGFISNGLINKSHQIVKINKGTSHGVKLLETLSLINDNNNTLDIIELLFKSNIALSNGLRIIFITPQVSDIYLKTLNLLKKKGITVDIFHILNSAKEKTPELYFKFNYSNLSCIKEDMIYAP